MQSIFHTVVTTIQCIGEFSPSNKGMFEGHPGLWAFGSALASLLYLVVSTTGLYFIWQQLRASQDALNSASVSAQAAADAANISFAATRPWLKIDVTGAHIYLNPENMEEVGCQLNYTISNVGNTPAIWAGLAFKPVPAGFSAEADPQEELAQLRSTAPHNSRVFFPNDKTTEGLSTNFPFPRQADERMLGFKVVVAVLYKAVREGETYWTPGIYQLQHKIPPTDHVYRFYRGMGSVECVVIRLSESPAPT